MKRVVLLFALAMFGFVGIGNAQTELPGQCSVFYPETLAKKAVIELTDASAIAKAPYGQSTKPASPKHWVVYSDRIDNVTYTKPDGSKVQFAKLGFNEQVRIAKIQNGYALVYTEPMSGIDYPKISHEAESKGWIPMSKLLLWHSCPADKYGIYQKALICANLDEQGGETSGRLIYNPENKSKFEQLSSDMKFYYVMKSEGNMSLLAHTHTLDGRSSMMLYGWVDQNSFVPWNQRSCLEPTWDKESVAYFVKHDHRIEFYANKNRDNILAHSGFVLKPEPPKYDKYLYRMSKDQLRYPILDGSTANLYNISTFTRLNSEGSYDMSAANDKAAMAVEYSEKITKEKTNINIGLVIDGTSSMGEFYPAVIDAIKKSCSDIFNAQYKVKVGAVIYRDYSDGDHSADVFRLTSPNQKEFYQWLESGNNYGIKSAAADKTYEEALYLGINTALDQLGFKSDQSNILIVVGDCGNDRNDTKFDREDIVKKIVSKDVHMIGFQVRNNTANQAFPLFTAQMSYLIKSSLERKYANLEMEVPVSVEIQKTNDGYELVNDQNSIIYIGSHSFPSSNTVMDLDKLSTLITRSVAKCAASVQRRIDLLMSHATVGFANSNIAGDVPAIDKAFVKSQVGEEYYEQLNKTNTLITFSGYADKEKDARELFKPVIFISSDELTELLAKLDPVNDAAAMENPNNREAYVNAMKALAMRLTGNSVDQVNSLGHREIMRMIQGLNSATESLKGYTIEQIANPQSVDNKTYLGLLTDFRRKYSYLRKIKDTKDWKYAIEMNGIKYYWIPAEDMP